MELFAFFGEVNAILAPVPGVGLAKNQVFFLQCVEHPGDVGLVFEDLFSDLPLGQPVFLTQMIGTAMANSSGMLCKTMAKATSTPIEGEAI